MVITLMAVMAIGVYSGRQVKNAADFELGGNRTGIPMVVGTFMGTLVGGNSTIGTAELAYDWGFSAWWFTIGLSIGIFIIGVVLAPAIRRSDSDTIQGLIRNEYGERVGVVTTVLSSLSILLMVFIQIMACNKLIYTLFGLPQELCGLIAIVLMASYVVFGGVLGTGALGVVKTVLVYIGVVYCAYLVFQLTDGLNAVTAALEPEKYFNLLSRGASTDIGAGVSVIAGVVATQTYYQAIRSASSLGVARKSAIISFALCAPVGFFSIMVGWYMRIAYPTMNSALAFPSFLVNHTHPIIAGVLIATLLIVSVGTGAGMLLGLGTIVNRDVYMRYINPHATPIQSLKASRWGIIGALIIGYLGTLLAGDSALLIWGFLSMGLRGVLLLAPMLYAMYAPGRISKETALWSVVAGLCTMVVSWVLNLPVDPVMLGIVLTFIVMAVPAFRNRKPQL